MKTKDTLTREHVREKMQKAFKENDTEKFYESFEQLIGIIDDENKEQYQNAISQMKKDIDIQVLSSRGVRQLTTEEKEYYQKFGSALKSENPKQAIANIDVIMPQTIIESVFEDIRNEHPLLAKIDFVNSGAAVKMVLNDSDEPTGSWGALSSQIVQEITLGFKTIETTLCKISAFIPVSMDALNLGPEWLDRIVRTYLYKAVSNSMETGITNGTGNNMPIGMNRSVYDGVTVTGGVYPKKTKIKVNCFDIETVGALYDMLATDARGNSRYVNADDVVLLVNPKDYYRKIKKATTILNAVGKYEYVIDMIKPENIIPVKGVDKDEAIFGIATRYAAFLNGGKDGKIEYSDENKFLEDQRVFKIKAYANGLPKDDNAFLLLDISTLTPPVPKFYEADEPAASTDDDLIALSLGRAVFNTTFVKSTTSYTATTTDTSNILKAVPSDANATLVCKLGDTVIENGKPVTWAAGSNTLTVKVTAADGSTNTTYTVTVTKS